MSESSRQKVYAEYRTSSVFEIPADVKEYTIHWNKLSYTDKDGNEVEVEPTHDGGDDHEMWHRPFDIHTEQEEDEDIVPEWFDQWADDIGHDELVEMLWNHIPFGNKREIKDQYKNILQWEDVYSYKNVTPTLWTEDTPHFHQNTTYLQTSTSQPERGYFVKRGEDCGVWSVERSLFQPWKIQKLDCILEFEKVEGKVGRCRLVKLNNK